MLSDEFIYLDLIPLTIICINTSRFKESTEDDIKNAFAAHGEVKKITMPTDKFTGKPRGFGFVQMADADATAAAIAALNESEINGRTIFVSESLPKDQVQKKRVGKRQNRGMLSFMLTGANCSIYSFV